MATMYRVLAEGFHGQGPFTGREVDDLVKAGRIAPDQDVQKVATGKVIKARVALSSAEANDAPARPVGPLRAVIGALLVVGSLTMVGWLLSVSDERHPVRFKHFIIPGLMLLIGGRSVISYLTAAKPRGEAATADRSP